MNTTPNKITFTHGTTISKVADPKWKMVICSLTHNVKGASKNFESLKGYDAKETLSVKERFDLMCECPAFLAVMDSLLIETTDTLLNFEEVKE